MGKKIDLMGNRYGRLVVIDKAHCDKNGIAMWVCKCDCGNIREIRSSDLRTGKTASCGCLHKEVLSNRMRKHGLKGTRLYTIWCDMKNRCTFPSVQGFESYGGRGIEVCSEWKVDFQAFHDWAMGNGYCDNLTLDRIDNDKGYSPDNCRWVSRAAQSNNLRKNVIVEINGEAHTLAEWAKINGIKYTTIYQRYLRGWTGESILKRV